MSPARRFAVLLLGVSVLGTRPSVALEDSLVFTGSQPPGSYVLATGELDGRIREEGKSVGLRPLRHRATGLLLTAEHTLLDYYRVFTTNHRYGDGMRYVPSESRVLEDGRLEVHWLAAEERPFELIATYRIARPNVIDLETRARALIDLPDFEVFIANYCSEAFPVTSVYVGDVEGATGQFITADKDSGTWQVFPRDDEAVSMIQDGRWTIPPSPVDWAARPRVAAPLMYRKDPTTGVTIVLMAPPDDCFAVFSSCEGEAHRSMYLGLFGRDVKEGEEVVAHTRMLVGENLTNEAIIKAYQEFIKAY